MAIVNLKKLLSILALIIIFVLMAPDIALGWTSQLDNATTVHSHQLWDQDNLTPQEHQELQAVRQRRNREITQVLNQSQRRQLEHFLRSGHDLEYAINTLDIDHDQWDTIQAIMELSTLKTKAILHRHSLPVPS
jgi:FKBP-type peptidyl-prolyl cis-trans isomerase 2